MPMIANEQLALPGEGALFVVGDSQIGWMIYAMAQKYHRDVSFLSPTYHNGMKELMDIGVTDLKNIQTQLFDFEKAMNERKIVIIDAEPYRHRKKSIELVGSVLMSLQSLMHTNSHDTPFFVYLEEGDTYLPYIKDLMLYGNQFGLGTILFLQSRSLMHAKSPQLSYFVEANIRTNILANGLVYDDFVYFKQRLLGDGEDDNFILQRKKEQLVVETLVKDMKTVKSVDVRFLAPQLYRELEEESERLKKKHDTIQTSGTYAYSVARPENEDALVAPKVSPKRTAKPRIVVPIPKPVSAPSNKIFLSEDDVFID